MARATKFVTYSMVLRDTFLLPDEESAFISVFDGDLKKGQRLTVIIDGHKFTLSTPLDVGEELVDSSGGIAEGVKWVGFEEGAGLFFTSEALRQVVEVGEGEIIVRLHDGDQRLDRQKIRYTAAEKFGLETGDVMDLELALPDIHGDRLPVLAPDDTRIAVIQLGSVFNYEIAGLLPNYDDYAGEISDLARPMIFMASLTNDDLTGEVLARQVVDRSGADAEIFTGLTVNMIYQPQDEGIDFAFVDQITGEVLQILGMQLFPYADPIETVPLYSLQIADLGLDLIRAMQFETGLSLTGGKGIDKLYGAARADMLTGFRGNDILDGGWGADLIKGGRGRDLLLGGEGDDTLSGAHGRDILNGGEGDDLLRGGRLTDQLYGGAGDDTLRGGGGQDSLRGGEGDDILHGGARRDWFWGGPGNDTMYGGAGRDVFHNVDGFLSDAEGYGDDVMYGGAGYDVFNASRGEDTMVGGEGWDLFVFADEIDTTTILDFEVGVDSLDLDYSDVLWPISDMPTIEELLADIFSVTDEGVRIDLAPGMVILLAGLDTLDGLADDIHIF